MKPTALLLGTLLAATTCGAAAPASLRVSSLGFDPADSTRFLQKALDSGAREVVVDKTDTPWITLPLKVRSNTRIVFEKGAVVEAKRGAYHDLHDSLFNFYCVTNVVLAGGGATLRMHRRDYQNPPYAKSQWRHVLNMQSVKDVTVEGLTLSDSGGDGIYLGTCQRGVPCRNVTIRDCDCARNHRQGISVISISGLLLENVVMRETSGHGPAAGIDFEPNTEYEVMENIVMRNCLTRDNQGRGCELELARFTRATKPVSFLFENCRSVNDQQSFTVACRVDISSISTPKGRVVVKNYSCEKARRSGMRVTCKPATSLELEFTDCTIDGSGTERPDEPDIALDHLGPYNEPTDGIVFRNLKIRQAKDREWIQLAGVPENITAPIRNIRGDVTLETPGRGTRRLTLDAAWCATRYPQAALAPTLPRVPFDGRATIVDTCPGEAVDLTGLRVRGTGIYLFHAPAAGTYHFDCELRPFDNPPRPRYFPLFITEFPSGKAVCNVSMEKLPFTAFDVKVPTAGFYQIVAEIKQRFTFRLVRSTVPVAFYDPADAQPLFNSTGSVWFHVPENAGFAFVLQGLPKERAAGTVFDPSGAKIWHKGAVGSWERCQVERPAPGLWRAEIGRPETHDMDDFRIDVTGIPSVMFLSERKYWK